MGQWLRPQTVGKAILLVWGALALGLGMVGTDLQVAKAEPDKAPPAKKFRYLCADDKSFTLAINTEGDCVLLTLDGKPIKLHRVVSGSGARYSNGQITVWLKGNEAFIERDGKIIIKNCRTQD